MADQTITRTFTLAELKELDAPYCDDVVHTEVIDTGRRWMDTVECVFKMQDDGHHYLLTYDQGKTEIQECYWWEDLDDVLELPRVELVTKTVVVETWEPVKDTTAEQLRALPACDDDTCCRVLHTPEAPRG